MTAILVVSAWALGILNSHRRFFVSYVAPVAWNLAIITAMIGSGSYPGLGRLGRDADLAVALAWGALAGGVLQLLVQTSLAPPSPQAFPALPGPASSGSRRRPSGISSRWWRPGAW